MKAKKRPLWRRRADTREGAEVLQKARALSLDLRNEHLTDGQLIRLAYWGATGEP